MSSRPVISVRGKDGAASSSTIPLPAVFTAPIRSDVVAQVHKSMAKNKRQPYAVKDGAGMSCHAQSWGTGRAVARLPRTHNGIGAHANSARGGRMFNPTTTHRRWHVKVNVGQKRFAVTSAIAASALPSLVLARGHRVEEVEEVPLVLSAEVESIAKTKAAVELLKAISAYADVEKVKNSKKTRAGKGSMRGRRHRQRRGPLVVYNEDNGIAHAFRNLPGVETANVRRLNLLQLAPGGHLGRFIIWTEGAIKMLDEIYGTHDTPATLKKDFILPSNKVTNPDISRLIKAPEITAVVRAANASKTKRTTSQHKNPLKNKAVMFRLNPYAKTFKRQAILRQEAKTKGHSKKELAEKKQPAGKAFLEGLLAP